MSEQTTIKVYIDNGEVYTYQCNAEAARDHTFEIMSGGYRSCNNDTGTLVCYPAHRIKKVKAIGGQHTNYPDSKEGT